MEGSPLRAALKSLIAETIDEVNQQNFTSNPEEGTVLSLNDDGTVVVQTSTNVYGDCGAAVVFTEGALVLVLTGDGRRVAIPR